MLSLWSRLVLRVTSRRFLAFLFCLLAALPAMAVDRSAFAFSRCDLQVTLDPHQHGLAAEGTVELRNISKLPQREVVLQLSSSLHWLSLLAGSQPVEWLQQTYTSDIDHTGALSEAIVMLDKPVAPGASVRLTVRYSGTITKDATRLERIGTPRQVASRSDWDEISDSFTALRGAGFVAWYPVAMEAANLARGNELFETLREWRQRQATSLLHVRVTRAPLTEGDESKFLFVASDPEAKPGTELIADFRGGDTPALVLLPDPGQTTDRPRVAAYYTADHTNFARDYMAATEAVIPALEEWFGTPRTKVVLVELTDPNALPYDVGSYYFVPMRTVQAAAAEVALTRPVVHSMLESPRPWIREGLTGFAQALVREHQAGRHAAIGYLGQFSSALEVAEAQSHSTAAVETGESQTASTQTPTPRATTPQVAEPQVEPIGLQPLITTADEVFFRTKAAYVWWMLRDMVGDRPLQIALSNYRASEDRDSAYMQRLIEAQLPAHRSLETFFDDWVYRDHGLPQLKVESAYMRKTLGDQTVTAVTIENLGEAWCEVPVTLRSSSGERNVRVEVPAKGKAVVRVPFESVPTEAEVNDGSVPESEHRDNITPVTSSP